jgi:hypothetical protein
MISSTIHVLILVPVFFAITKERALKRNSALNPSRLGACCSRPK